ncbi:hypothetical protein BGZ72_001689 [Mortierella alpina]|nr:hypothetical protein BGZ72_001689 [Mortierella alpina]
MDLNWCPVCEQHIPLAWESSLYCSERCKQADERASNSFPAEMQSFPRSSNNGQRGSISSPMYSPLSSPTLVGVNANSAAASSAYPSPPTSPMTNYIYNKTSAYGRVSPPAFSLGHSANYDLELRRKSTTTIAAPQYTMSTMTSNNSLANKKGFFY